MIHASGDLDEQLTAAAEVSAPRIVVGVMLDTEDPGDEPLVAVTLPAAWGGAPVCARFVSAEALYEARTEYEVPGDLGTGTALLEFATRHADALLALHAEEFAIALSRGRCADAGTEFAAALWRSVDPSADDEVRVLVNGLGATEVYAWVAAPDGGFDISCRIPPNGSAVAFDHVCALPRDQLAVGEATQIEINRISFGAPQRPEIIKLWN